MVIAIARSRGQGGSRRKFPPEYARSESFEQMIAGGGGSGTGGGGAQQRVWKRYPERWVTRGVITRSGIAPRPARLVRWMELVPN
jgi:hypothetical protein